MNNNGHKPAPRYDFRHACGRLLFRGHLPLGTFLHLRCPKCGQSVIIHITAQQTAIDYLKRQVDKLEENSYTIKQ